VARFAVEKRRDVPLRFCGPRLKEQVWTMHVGDAYIWLKLVYLCETVWSDERILGRPKVEEGARILHELRVVVDAQHRCHPGSDRFAVHRAHHPAHGAGELVIAAGEKTSDRPLGRGPSEKTIGKTGEQLRN